MTSCDDELETVNYNMTLSNMIMYHLPSVYVLTDTSLLLTLILLSLVVDIACTVMV